MRERDIHQLPTLGNKRWNQSMLRISDARIEHATLWIVQLRFGSVFPNFTQTKTGSTTSAAQATLLHFYD